MAEMTAPVAPQQDSSEGVQGQVQDAAGQAKEKTQEAAAQAQQKAGDKVREQVDQRSTQAGEQVTTTASDLRSVGEELRKQGKDTPARLASQAADRADRLGGYLRDSGPDKILSDVEGYARRQPWAVVAGGVALGFAASRFVKASSGERYRASQGIPQPASPQPAATIPPPPPPVTPGAYIPPR